MNNNNNQDNAWRHSSTCFSTPLLLHSIPLTIIGKFRLIPGNVSGQNLSSLLMTSTELVKTFENKTQKETLKKCQNLTVYSDHTLLLKEKF